MIFKKKMYNNSTYLKQGGRKDVDSQWRPTVQMYGERSHFYLDVSCALVVYLMNLPLKLENQPSVYRYE